MRQSWNRLRASAVRIGSPLACPNCEFYFSPRHFALADGICTRCKEFLGYPLYFRLILLGVYLAIAVKVVYPAIASNEPVKLMLALFYALAIGVIARLALIHSLAPKLVVLRAGHALTCPLCSERFSWRQFQRAGRLCPHCRTPLGTSLAYRAVLLCIYLAIAAKLVYSALLTNNFPLVMASMAFSVVIGFVAMAIVAQTFPPKLQAHAEGLVWLNLK